MGNRETKITIRKANELIEKGIVKIYDNDYNQKILDWKLDKEEYLISPSGKLRISYNLLNRILQRTQGIIRQVKKYEKKC